jgi:biopolymer transport protein TolR
MRKAEINVTPLIDILLVLLVIFIATVTVTQQAIETELPRNTRAGPSAGDTQIMVEVSADRRMSVNSQAVTLPELEPFLREVYRERADKTIYVAAAGTLPYRAVVDVMDAARGAGVRRVGVITEGMRAQTVQSSK